MKIRCSLLLYLAPATLASPNGLRRLSCSSDTDCTSFGSNYCCSQWGYCGTGGSYCSGGPPPPSPPPPTPTSGGCAPAYVEGRSYGANEEASNGGKNYACKPYPYTGWCSGASWAYAPGTGTHWQDAWVLVHDCGGGPTHPPIPSPTPPTTPPQPTPPSRPPTPTPRPPPTPPTTPSQSTIIGYYASWQWYDRSKLAKPTNMDFSKLQRVNFAFFQTDVNGNIWGTDPYADPQVLFGPSDWNPQADAKKYCSWDSATNKSCKNHKYDEGLIKLAHSAGTEVYPSLGGWKMSKSFPALAASATARENLANKCVELIKDYDFDGIDIDWEYPGYKDHSGTDADKVNYSLLLEEVRNKLDDLTTATGKFYGLTAAVPCGPSNMRNIEVARVAGILSEVNLMTYDFHGAWDSTTGVNAPLYEQGWGPEEFDVHNCVNNWVAAGASRSKINIGLPFYGRSFSRATGLDEGHGGPDKINWGGDGVPMYYDVVSKLPTMTSLRHEDTKTQYAYFNGGGLVSYDDKQAICDKTEYALQNGLNGFIIWELSGDLMPDLSTPLLDMVNMKLANPNLQCGS